MAVRKMVMDLDFQKNQALNMVLHVSSTAPTNPVEGQFYYDSVAKTPKHWDGSKWTNGIPKSALELIMGALTDTSQMTDEQLVPLSTDSVNAAICKLYQILLNDESEISSSLNDLSSNKQDKVLTGLSTNTGETESELKVVATDTVLQAVAKLLRLDYLIEDITAEALNDLNSKIRTIRANYATLSGEWKATRNSIGDLSEDEEVTAEGLAHLYSLYRNLKYFMTKMNDRVTALENS